MTISHIVRRRRLFAKHGVNADNELFAETDKPIMQVDAITSALIVAAEQAGAAIMNIYRNEATETTIKADGSPLTQADMAAHRIIAEHLQRFDWPVLSEESAELPFATRQQQSTYFLVDPLDGTKEFIHRTDEFTVNIALIENGVAVRGVVFAPALDLIYVGGQGIGAWKKADGKAWQAIQVSNRVPSASSPLRVVGSRRHGAEKLAAMLADVPHELDNRGSALKICQVAEGSADFYPRLGPTSEWDTAAGQAIVEAAGGHLTDMQLQPLRYNQKDSLLNPNFLVLNQSHAQWIPRLNLA